MKRPTAIEKCAVVFGLIFVIAGASMIIHPTDLTIFHAGPGKYSSIVGPGKPDNISKRGVQIYGGIAVVTGISLICLAVNRGRK